MIFSAKSEYPIEIEITSADITKVLNQITDAGVKLHFISFLNDLVVRLSISPKDYQSILGIVKRTDASVKCVKISGFTRLKDKLLNRPVLCFFFAVFMIFSLVIPNKVLFVTVNGNNHISANKILEAAENSGIRFWTSRRAVRSEKIKNMLLVSIPELQWVGVNTIGCTAVISVKEKTVQEEYYKANTSGSSIVAARDGIIQRYTVLKGNPLMDVGQAVTKGQILVSGYHDCGIVTQITHADAEIFAITFREIKVVSPKSPTIHKRLSDKKVRYSVRIGKNIINLYKDSGILDTTCGKICEEKYLKLPGGFELPLSIIKETVFHYSIDLNSSVDNSDIVWMKNFAGNYIEAQMVSGQIISSKSKISQQGAITHLYGRYTCLEMISQIISEDTIQKDEQHGRQDNQIGSN